MRRGERRALGRDSASSTVEGIHVGKVERMSSARRDPDRLDVAGAVREREQAWLAQRSLAEAKNVQESLIVL